MVTHSLGQCGPYLLQSFRDHADRYAQTMFGFSLYENTPQSSVPTHFPATSKLSYTSGPKISQNSQRILRCIFEDITTRIYGMTRCSSAVLRWINFLMNYCLGKMDPNWAKCLKSGQFKFRPGKGVFWGWLGGVLCKYIFQNWVCDGWVENRGWWWYSGQIETPFGQNETHLGNLYRKWAQVQ